MGSWFGRGMQAPTSAFDPDVIVSTYPLGSAGLRWLRGRGRLSMPIGAWIPALCPHPSWLYRNLDITYVMHAFSLEVAVKAEPGMRVAVGALPVRDAFAPAEQAAARERLGLGASLAFGRLDRAVTAVLAAGPDVQAGRGLRPQRAPAPGTGRPRRAAGPAAGAWLDR